MRRFVIPGRVSSRAAVSALVCLAVFAAVSTAWAQPATVVPVPRNDKGWMDRHESMNARVKQGNVDMLFIGDSITHGWEGGGKGVWELCYADRNAVNLGIGGDRTEHVLWRLQNGNIEGVSPKVAMVMIGTNNCRDNSAEEIAQGVEAIVTLLRQRLPEMRILLLAIFPRADVEPELQQKVKDASALFSRNLLNFITPMVDKETRALTINLEDEVVKGTLVTRDGQIVHPSLTQA